MPAGGQTTKVRRKRLAAKPKQSVSQALQSGPSVVRAKPIPRVYGTVNTRSGASTSRNTKQKPKKVKRIVGHTNVPIKQFTVGNLLTGGSGGGSDYNITQSGKSRVVSGVDHPQIKLASPGHQTVLKVLDQTTRPIHGIAGGVDAAITGKNIGKSVVRGLQNKDRKTFGDVLKHLGAPKFVQAAGGFTGDVLLDPTTYATLGTGTVAKKAAVSAAEHAAANKGVQAGLRFHVPLTNVTKVVKTSGRGTAAVSRALKLPQVSGKLHDSRAVQAVGEAVVPGFRKAGVPKAAHQATREARAAHLGAQSQAEQKVVNRAHAYAKAVKTPQEHQAVIDALEAESRKFSHRQSVKSVARHERKTGTRIVTKVPRDTSGIAGLPDHLQAPAAALQQDFAGMGAEEMRRNLLSVQRDSYFPHVSPEVITPIKGEKQFGSRTKATLASSSRRGDQRPLVKIRQTDPAKFSEDLVNVYAHRALAHHQAINLQDYWTRIAGAGKPLTPTTDIHLGGGESVYRQTPAGLERLTTGNRPKLAAIQHALNKTEAGALKPGERFFVLNDQTVADAEAALKSNVPSEHKILHGYDKVQGGIKYYQTIPNPGYHVNNLVGDTSMGRQGDATTRDLLDAGKVVKAKRAVTKYERSPASLSAPMAKSGTTIPIAGKKVPVEDLLARADAAGINLGFQGQELKMLRDGKTGGKLAAASQARESFPRYASFISALKRGMTDAQAAKHVADHHIDYTDLTPFERGGLRRVIPFYTFTARNAKLQAKKIVTRPRVAASYQKGREEIGKATGVDVQQVDGLINKYQQRGAPLYVGGHNVFPRLPVVSGTNTVVGNPGQTLINATSPLIKVPAELATNYNPFFNEPIVDKKNPLVPAPDFVGKLPGPLRDALNVKQIKDKRSGKMVWGWDPRVALLLNQVPQTNVAQQLATSTANRHGTDRALGLINYVSGVKVAKRDDTSNAINGAYERSQSILDRQAALRQQGKKETPEYKHLAAQEKAVQKQLVVLKKRRGDKVISGQKVRKVKRTDSLGLPSGSGGGNSLGLGGGSSSGDSLGL